MKAYMSDSAGRWDVARDVHKCLVATATAEARAILAETEPERPAGAPGRWYGFQDIHSFALAEQRYGKSSNGSVRLALAEALAAFVEG